VFDLFVEAGPPSIYTAARCLCVFILSIYPYCASIILQRKNIANEKGVLLAPQYIKNTIAGAMVTSLAKRQRKAKTQTKAKPQIEPILNIKQSGSKRLASKLSTPTIRRCGRSQAIRLDRRTRNGRQNYLSGRNWKVFVPVPLHLFPCVHLIFDFPAQVIEVGMLHRPGCRTPLVRVKVQHLLVQARERKGR
jgi:hypothetical protein